MPKISIVMPVYNAEKYLRACLDSVLAQTLHDFELICVDDGSTDDSLAILKEYERKVEVESRNRREDGFDFKVISCDHTNAGHCRNVGLAQSRGEYLLFLDADDVFAPEMFKTLLDALVEEDADVAICNYVEFDDGDDFTRSWARTGRAARHVYREPSRTVDVFRWNACPWTKMIARRIVDKYALSFQEQRSINDVLFILSALSVAQTIVECPDALVAYRKHADSITATRGKSPTCFYDAFVGYYDKMRRLGIFPNNEWLLDNFRVYSCDQSFWHLDSAASADAAKTVFPLLKDLCRRWNWCEALARDGKHPLLGQRCESLMQADDVAEAYRRDFGFLRECHEELVAIKRSHTYRFAQMLVGLIRRFRG